MKYIFYILVLALFLMTSCSGNSSSKDAKTTNNEVTLKPESNYNEKSTDQIGGNDCHEFLDNFGNWSDEYILLLTNFTSSPADPGLAKEYNRLTREYSGWKNGWSDLATCANDDEYKRRYDEINRKIEKKQRALRGG